MKKLPCLDKAILDPDGYKKAKSSLARMKKMEEEVLNNKYYQNSFEWRFEYPQLLDDQGHFTGFDIIIANPPYIKEGRMSKTFFEPYKKSPYYKGKMDIWYLFACNCIDLLKDNGSLCFIATNNWTTSFGASILRNKVIKETRICKLIDFGAVMMFESASIQTMIMLFNKDRVTDDYSFDYRRLTTNKATEKDAIALLDGTSQNSVCFQPVVRKSNYSNKILTFSNNDDLLNKIKETVGCIYLDSSEIAQGIVPNPDEVNKRNIHLIPSNIISQYNISIGDGVFVVDKEEIKKITANESKYIKELIEPTLLTRYSIPKDIIPQKRLLYITKQNYRNDAPDIVSHLEKFRSIMDQRRENMSGRLDFYHIHWPRTETFFQQGEKILVPRKSPIPLFAYRMEEAYVMMAINIIKTNRVNMKYLTGLLNSKLIEFWLKNKGKMQGSNFQLDKEPLLQIPIAVPSREMQSLIAKLVDCIILINNVQDVRINKFVSNEYLAKMFELLIDGCVYEIYLGEELHRIGIHVFDTIRNIVENCSIDNDNLASVSELYKSIEETGVIQKLDNLEHYSPDIFKPIIMN